MADRPAVIETYTDAILERYDAADAADIAAGLAWYDRAERTMAAMARYFGVPRETAAGVVAALSPRVQWAPNVAAAERMLAAAGAGASEPRVNGYGANRRKAWAIAQGADPETVLGGPKVTAFYSNLTGDPDRVTVDVWAARGAGLDMPDGRTLSARTMRELGKAYATAAERRGITPRQLQAAVWVAVRGRAN